MAAHIWAFACMLRHTNPLNNCHGGMLASFGDMLLPVCIHRQSAEVGLRFLPTISLQIDYLAPAPLGAWVQGEADVLRVTRTMVFAHGVARVDGTPVIRVSGIFKIGQPFDRPVEGAGVGSGRARLSAGAGSTTPAWRRRGRVRCATC